jgi:hypothetical protein
MSLEHALCRTFWLGVTFVSAGNAGPIRGAAPRHRFAAVELQAHLMFGKKGLSFNSRSVCQHESCDLWPRVHVALTERRPYQRGE